MVPPSTHWLAERSRLVVVALSLVAALVLVYDYAAATGEAGVLLAIVGAGVLLAVLVAVPVLLFENGPESH